MLSTYEYKAELESKLHCVYGYSDVVIFACEAQKAQKQRKVSRI